MPDDLSFRESNITSVLKFSTDQWHEFALRLGLCLQEIADCCSAQCNYPNTLLRRWLSTDDSASWYTLMIIVKSMLPPACDYAGTIVQKHPSITKDNEAELNDLQEIIPFNHRLPTNFEKNILQIEQMNVVDEAIENVAVDERLKAIEEIVRAFRDELEQKSGSEKYWKKLEQSDMDLMNAISAQNDWIERFLGRTNTLCSDLTSRNNELQQLTNKVTLECQEIDQLNNKVQLKNAIFEELNEQLIRLQRLKSQNTERLAALMSIPSKVNQFKQDADKNNELCEKAKRKLSMVLQRQIELLSRVTDLLNKTEHYLSGVIKDIYTAQASRAALMATLAGVGTMVGTTLITWGATAIIWAGAAVAGGVYGWKTYEKTSRKIMNTFLEHVREAKAKCIHLIEEVNQIRTKFKSLLLKI